MSSIYQHLRKIQNPLKFFAIFFSPLICGLIVLTLFFGPKVPKDFLKGQFTASNPLASFDIDAHLAYLAFLEIQKRPPTAEEVYTYNHFPFFYQVNQVLLSIFPTPTGAIRACLCLQILIFSIGIFLFLKTLDLFIKDRAIVISTSLVLCTLTPILYIPLHWNQEVWVFSFFIMSSYFFCKFLKFEKLVNWLLTSFFMSVGFLFKITLLIPLVCQLGSLFLNRSKLKSNIRLAFLFLLVFFSLNFSLIQNKKIQQNFQWTKNINAIQFPTSALNRDNLKATLFRLDPRFLTDPNIIPVDDSAKTPIWTQTLLTLFYQVKYRASIQIPKFLRIPFLWLGISILLIFSFHVCKFILKVKISENHLPYLCFHFSTLLLSILSYWSFTLKISEYWIAHIEYLSYSIVSFLFLGAMSMEKYGSTRIKTILVNLSFAFYSLGFSSMALIVLRLFKLSNL